MFILQNRSIIQRYMAFNTLTLKILYLHKKNQITILHKSLHFRHSKRPSHIRPPHNPHLHSLMITRKFACPKSIHTYSDRKKENCWKNNTKLVPFPQRGKFYLNARVMSANPVAPAVPARMHPRVRGGLAALHIYVLGELHQRRLGIGETRK